MPELTELLYSTDTSGPFKLYILDEDGYHSGGQWFNYTIRYPDEEITVAAAKQLSDGAVARGREVRICDGGDWLVFHSVDGRQLHPAPGIDFWVRLSDGGQS